MNKIISRMCFICRGVYSKNEMLRLVKTSQGEILIDKTGKSDGRGAYICKNESCINQIAKRKVLNRAFKCEFPSDVYTKLCEELFDNKK